MTSKVSFELEKYSSSKRKKTNEWFFKTGKGQYGAHDKFLGISNPEVRKVAKNFYSISLSDLGKIISSPYNEERLCVLVILIQKFKKGSEKERKKIFSFYLRHLGRINNWNLVDISAPHIVGEYLWENKKERKILDKMVQSKSLWERRISIISTVIFIKKGDFRYTLRNAKKLLPDPHDLTHKASGWMLREIWKKDNLACENFLQKNYPKIPRTTLRYAIEKMPETKRKRFLKGNFGREVL